MEPLEVELAVLAEAAPINTRRSYYYVAGFLLLLAAFAAVLGVLLSGSDEATADTDPLPSDLEATLATVPKTICYDRVPGQGLSEHCSMNETMAQGGGVPNLVCQALLDHFPDADLVIMNAGACRGDIVQGKFTGRDVHNLYPFYNTLWLLEMTGMEIKLVLEQALEYIFGDPDDFHTGGYPYAAGMKYAVDMSASFENRLSNMQAKDGATGIWTALDPDTLYTVVANSYIMEGGDNYLLFSEISNVVETTVETTDAFLEYARDQGVLLDPPLDDYSTISYVPP
jgi:5'-nucleotidase